MILSEINFSEIFKKDFLNNFTNNVSTATIGITLLYAFLVSIYVYLLYKFTFKGTIYSQRFNSTMALMSIVTAAIVLSMQSNVVVSLGMVGALSIVRFRTAIKEPRDLLFLFWSISNGIVIGAQVYEIAFILAIVLSIALIFFDLFPEKKSQWLLVANLKNKLEIKDNIHQLFQKYKIKYIIKSQNITESGINIIYEFNLKNKTGFIDEIFKIKGIGDINIINQDDNIKY